MLTKEEVAQENIGAKLINCLYLRRVGFQKNIYGFLYRKIETTTNYDGTKTVRKFPPVERRVKIFSDGSFDVHDFWMDKNIAMHLCSNQEEFDNLPVNEKGQVNINRYRLSKLIENGRVRIPDEDLEEEILGVKKIEKISVYNYDVQTEIIPQDPENAKVFNKKKPLDLETLNKKRANVAKARAAKQKKKEEAEKSDVDKASPIEADSNNE